MLIPFTKYEGCGNDFIIVDHRTQFLNAFSPSLYAKMCHRQQGIGADGVLLLETSACADFRMRIFNADGSEAEMCGNGLRCFGKYLHSLFPSQHQFLVETVTQKNKVSLKGEQVELSLSVSIQVPSPITIHIDQQTFTVHHLDTGVPHAVIFNHEQDAFEKFAHKIRHHPHFFPHGTNVNFVKIEYQHNKEPVLFIRTFERGVEKETLACGTGAIAAALVAAKQYLLKAPLCVVPLSGVRLTISFKEEKQYYREIRMIGPAIKVFEGVYKLSI